MAGFKSEESGRNEIGMTGRLQIGIDGRLHRNAHTARQGAASSLRFVVVVGFSIEIALVADLDFGDERKEERDLGLITLRRSAPNAAANNRWGELKIR